jgi:hypothetical protein
MRQARLSSGFCGEAGVEDNGRNLGKGDASVPTPLHTASAPTRGLIITHIFWNISVNIGDKAFRIVEFVHKLCPVIPLHKRPQKDMGNDETRGDHPSSFA